MKKQLILIITLLINILFLTQMVCGETLTSSGDFLKIGIGGRYNGMGESLVGLVDDVEAINVNIGGLNDLTNLQLMLEHSELYSGLPDGLRYEAFASGIPLRFLISSKKDLGIIGINFFYLYTPVPSYDDWGIATETGYSGMKGSLGYSRSIYKTGKLKVSSGVVVSYIKQGIDDVSEGSMSFDLGFKGKLKWAKVNLRKMLGDNLNIGLVLQNISGSGEENEGMPMGMKLGLGVKIYNMVYMDLDTIKYFNSPFKLNIGFEYWIKKIAAIRVGGKIGSGQLNFFSAGIGVNYPFMGKKFTFDYSLTPYMELQMVHRMGIKFEMSKPKPKKIDPDVLYYEGVNYFISKDCKNAIKKWKKVLKIDPGYEKAGERIKEAEQVMNMEKKMEDLKDIEKDYKKYQEMQKKKAK